jgi:hypothetical protein
MYAEIAVPYSGIVRTRSFPAALLGLSRRLPRDCEQVGVAALFRGQVLRVALFQGQLGSGTEMLSCPVRTQGPTGSDGLEPVLSPHSLCSAARLIT